MSAVVSKKSTSVRSGSSRLRRPKSRAGTPIAARAEQLVGASVGALGRVAPDLAGRVAAELFFRTRRGPLPKAERALLAEGAPFFVPSEGDRLAAWSWGEGPAVLLVHGWNGRAGHLAPYVRALRSEGLRPVAFDHVGHGLSSGETADLFRMARGLRAVSEVAGGVRAVITHSMGGAALQLALADGLRTERVALIASPIDPRPFLGQLTTTLGLDERVAARTVGHVERRVGRSLGSVYGPSLAAGFHVPALLVHDEGDPVVPFAASAELAAAWPGARLVPTRGLGHRRILADPDVVEAIRAFVTA